LTAKYFIKFIKASFLVSVILSALSLAYAEDSASVRQSFNVGVIIPLTGELAEYGTAIRNGFELASSKSQHKFSNIRFIYEDSRYDGKTAVSALQKLHSMNSVDLYYLWGVSPTEAMLPIAAAERLPVIAETTVKEATVGKELVIRAARTGERIAGALAQELVARKFKSVSIISAEIPFYEDILKHLEIFLVVNGISIISKKEILPSETDFKSFLLKQSAAKAEAYGVFLLPAQFPIFFKQAEQMNIKINAFSGDILDSETIVQSCPDNINNTFFTQVGVTPQFRDRYKSTFGDENHVGSAAQSFDLGEVIGELFNDNSKKLSPTEVIEKFSQMPEHHGVTGTFHYTVTPEAGKELRMPVSMRIIRNKQIETITEDTGF